MPARTKCHAKVDSRPLDTPVAEDAHLQVNTTFPFGNQIDRIGDGLLDGGKLRLG
jgi:hypothetical protein